MNPDNDNPALKIGLAQLNSADSKADNLRAIQEAVHTLADQGADLIVLPEHADFIGPDARKAAEAEEIGDSSYLASISAMAAARSCHIHIGSYLEKDGESVYNTAVVFDQAGTLLARYRKLHLFDVEIPGGRNYHESAVISSGAETALFGIGPFTFGMATCYDLRFPELFRRLVLQGANVILLPAAFTLQTGRDHWEVLLRARAIENQCWVAGVGQWGSAPPHHLCYGRSMVIDPWGLVIAQAQDAVTTLVARIDLGAVRAVRTSFPALDHIRRDIFSF